MALQFILGTAGKNHFQKMCDHLSAEMGKHPDDQFFYLVPNHIKFEYELNTLKNLNTKKADVYAQAQVQVFSFSRLAWYYLNEASEYQLPRLSKDAINMLILQIIKENQDQLTVFKGEGVKPGFIAKIADQITELQQGEIGPDSLDKMKNSDAQALNPELRSKLHDLNIIYREFLKRTDDKYLYPDKTLEILNNFLQSKDLSHVHFYISGFSHFSAQEYKVVQTLIAKAQSLVVDLNLDRPYSHELPETGSFFAKSGKLYYQLYQCAKGLSVKIMTDQYADETRVSPELSDLEKYWIASSDINAKIPVRKNGNHDVRVYEANNPYDELMNAATLIRQLVASGNYRYGDFLVITRHLSEYQNVLNPIMRMQKIPYFIDSQKKMNNHPLVQLIDALFSIYRKGSYHNYQYDDIMRLLKSELLLPKNADGSYMNKKRYEHEVALCDNYVLKTGYEGKKWLQKEDWNVMKITPESNSVDVQRNRELAKPINHIRHFIKDLLPPFYKKMEKAKTGLQASKILYQFLLDNGVCDQLKQWQKEATDKDDLQEAGQCEQVWDTFCDVLDDYVAMLGGQAFDLDSFLDILKAAFTGASFSQIPSTIDEVTFSETGMVQANTNKITFIIGADDDNMPAAYVNEALLSDADRDEMQPFFGTGQYLDDNDEASMANEPYLNYLTFMTPSQKLIFSFNRGGNDEGAPNQLSPYVKRIVAHYELQIHKVKANPKANEANIISYVGTKRATLRFLIKASANGKLENEELSSSWKNVKQQLMSDSDLKTLTIKLLGSLDYQNKPVRLKAEIVTGLYKDEINTSISKLEEFYDNPYEYFLKYGLKLKERDEFALSPAETGTFYHDSLDQLVKKANKENIDLASLSASDINKLVDEVCAHVIEDDPNQQYEIFKSSSRMAYIKTQLVLTVKQMARTLSSQEQRTKMRPRNTEVVFGTPGDPDSLAGINFVLPNHKKVNVRGRIDRIDKMIIDGTEYLGVVDYKSGDRDIDWSMVYDGLSMQMVTYLDAVLKNKNQLSNTDKAKLAGALYMHIENPLIKKDKVNLNDPAQVQKALMEADAYKGFLIDNDKMLEDMVKVPQDAKEVYPYKFKKDNQLTKRSLENILNPDEVKLVINHNEQKIKEAANRIFAGDIDLMPAKYKENHLGLKYSPYKAIMQFDPLLPDNNYRIVPSLGSKDAFLAQLKKEDNQDDQ